MKKILLFFENTGTKTINVFNDFKKFILLSVSGYLPKIISYTIIGRNAFNPFSASFIIPVMISSFLSGTGLLITRKIILFIRRKGEEDVKI